MINCPCARSASGGLLFWNALAIVTVIKMERPGAVDSVVSNRKRNSTTLVTHPISKSRKINKALSITYGDLGALCFATKLYQNMYQRGGI